MRNVPLLTMIRDIITAEPEKHDQKWWATVPADAITLEAFEASADGGLPVLCTSACCVAGFACMLSGDQAYVYAEDLTGYANERFYSIEHVLTPGGSVERIDPRAVDLLGLDSCEADILFEGDNSRDLTLTLLNDLIDGKDIICYSDDEEYVD